jgi:hypothetical protein
MGTCGQASAGSGDPRTAIAIRLNNLAQLLQDTNRLAEAEPLMRRVVEIFVQFGKATGHQHPNMQAAIENYTLLLEAMRLTEPEIKQRMAKIIQ